MPVRHARSETRGRPPCGRRDGNWQERFDEISQRIWQQRGGHTASRYRAEEDQVSEVLLRALRLDCQQEHGFVLLVADAPPVH